MYGTLGASLGEALNADTHQKLTSTLATVQTPFRALPIVLPRMSLVRYIPKIRRRNAFPTLGPFPVFRQKQN